MHVTLMRSDFGLDPPSAVNHAISATGASPSLRARPPCCLAFSSPAAEDGAALLDMWAVIKPGHVREKIAIFTEEAGERNHASFLGTARAGKVKGRWQENGDAKRRRRSADSQNLPEDLGSSAHILASGRGDVEGVERKVSVGEMVAFLERRASVHQADSKPLLALHKSFAAPPPQDKGEEPECVKVSDMVAKLESECLRCRTEGGVSRSNSLRSVGRVLLATAHHFPAPSPCPSGASALATPSFRPSGGSPEASPSLAEEAEPLPGLLFLSPPPTSTHLGSTPLACTDTDLTFGSSTPPSQPRRVCALSSSVTRCASTSLNFLELRQRLRQLLEPPPTAPLSALPADVLVGIFALLPTRTLAALKCTCRYFKSVIDSYAVRPADALWVSDPRYRDDPCKRCKRRYVRGDTSLCRWHHKPYCQPLPYGPGYWMCCHGTHRGAPGCKLGLHDNRWVPAFHSINVPFCRGNSSD
ncbi:F-box only protein 34 [Entelurus aequoreus]|uniref:F-box only protein 34 n=1 Tax=Entelurus aequoreus TaxID=161455 RepID=UPI002B1E5565|nr:F-box only protein 34 [Entelurus aequoreus]